MHYTGVGLVEGCLALCAHQAGGVPVQVWSHVQPVVVLDGLLAAVAHQQLTAVQVGFHSSACMWGDVWYM